jgi:hypothetical protein
MSKLLASGGIEDEVRTSREVAMSPATPFFSLPEYWETDWRKQSLHHYLRFTTVLHSLFLFLKWEFEDG